MFQQGQINIKIFKQPLTLILLFFALEETGVESAAWAASQTTRILGNVAHFQRLPELLRVIRSEAIYVCVALAAVRFMSRITKEVTLSNIGLTKRLAAFELAGGFAAQVMLIFSVLTITHNIGALNFFSTVPQAWLLQIAVMFLLTAVAEEIVSRGYVFQMAERHWGSAVAMVLSSLLFGLGHIIGGGLAASGQAYLAFLSGFLLCGAYLITRSLWLPIGLHWAWDILDTILFGGWGYRGILSGGVSLQDQYTISALCEVFQLGLTGLIIFIAVRRGQWQPSKLKLENPFRRLE